MHSVFFFYKKYLNLGSSWRSTFTCDNKTVTATHRVRVLSPSRRSIPNCKKSPDFNLNGLDDCPCSDNRIAFKNVPVCDPISFIKHLM